MIAKIKFGDQHLTFSLIDSPISKKWVECLNKWNEQSIPMKMHRFTAPYNYPVEHYNEQEIVNNLNHAIDNANVFISGKKFPYKAHLDMPWQQTNRIHRCFTTADTTEKTWKHNLGYEQLIKVKEESYLNKGPFLDSNTEAEFKITDYKKFRSYIHGINKWCHHYEDLRLSKRSRQLSDSIILPNPDWNYSVLEIEWDNYNEFGIREWPGIDRATYKEVYDTFFTDGASLCDIFLSVNITGKDYETAYFHYDDPLEFDITNLDLINGGVRIYNKEYLDYLYGKDGVLIKWTSDLGIPHEMVRPIPLGKILTSTVDLSKFDLDYKKTYSDDTYAAIEPFYRPVIELESDIDVKSQTNLL